MFSGRFGNQADHFLGALAFAFGLNRTLALPPWVEYRYGELKSIQVPFETYFQVEPLKNFHKVVTMENFMKNIAPVEWPLNQRKSFCYMARGIYIDNVACCLKMFISQFFISIFYYTKAFQCVQRKNLFHIINITIQFL